jgi:hypothetical protein
MNCTGTSEATFRVGQKAVDCCEIDLWHTLWSPDCRFGGCADWSLEMVEELAISSGMTGRIVGADEERLARADPECYGSVGEARAFDIACQDGTDTTHFINDPEIERALDLWREQDNMDDISEPSYFTQWDQSLNGTTWVSDGSRGFREPVLLTPEKLQQTDKLNILVYDEMDGGELIPDQLVTLDIISAGENHGVAKCAYGGVFITKGSLKYLVKEGRSTFVGDKFNCWITFTNAKYPWRTCVNGVVH